MMDWALRVNSEEFKAEARANQEAHEAAMAVAKAESDRLWVDYRTRREQLEREREEVMRPLKEAMRAAGIKLQLFSYDGVWGEYQIGDGPVVDIEEGGFDAWGD
jgi:hypothetical protein